MIEIVDIDAAHKLWVRLNEHVAAFVSFSKEMDSVRKNGIRVRQFS